MIDASDTQKTIEDLYDRVSFTAKARYNAARRLTFHSICSQWTLAILAVGQVVISLIPALGLSTFDANWQNFGSVFFGVLVLAYSLLLGMGNYAARSVQLHSCGIELSGLAREVHLYKESSCNLGECQDATKRYYAILSKCENHAHCDFLATEADLERKLLKTLTDQWKTADSKESKFPALELFLYYLAHTRAQFSKWIQFAHYVVTLVALFGWLWLIARPS